MSKYRFLKCYGADIYIKEVKSWLFSRWKIEKVGGVLPCLYTRVCGTFMRIDYDERFRKDNLWKPSEEQIEALDAVYKTHGMSITNKATILKLLNDLKKLM